MNSRREFIRFAIKNAFLLTAGKSMIPALTGSAVLPHRSELILRFAIASDGHYGQEKTDFESKHDLIIRTLNEEHRNRGVDFTFINGDLYHNDPKHLRPVKEKWAALQMPWYVSHGNHDQTSETEWRAVFGKEWQYAFEMGSCAFIVLNTATPEGEYACPDLVKAKSLLNACAQHRNLFVFMHITPFKWTKGGIDCPELVNMFNQQPNLRAVFHGHDHDQEEVRMNQNIPYIFDAHVAGDWGLPYTGYRIVEVLKDQNILSYQMNANLREEINRKRIF